MPNFGDLGANEVWPIQDFFGFWSTGQSIANASGADITFLTFTMPFTGMIICHAAVNAYFTTGGVQVWASSLSCAADEPDVAPATTIRSEGGTSAGYYHATAPVYAKWNAVSSGTSMSVHAYVGTGSGGLTTYVYSIWGVARCYRT